MMLARGFFLATSLLCLLLHAQVGGSPSPPLHPGVQGLSTNDEENSSGLEKTKVRGVQADSPHADQLRPQHTHPPHEGSTAPAAGPEDLKAMTCSNSDHQAHTGDAPPPAAGVECTKHPAQPQAGEQQQARPPSRQPQHTANGNVERPKRSPTVIPSPDDFEREHPDPKPGGPRSPAEPVAADTLNGGVASNDIGAASPSLANSHSHMKGASEDGGGGGAGGGGSHHNHISHLEGVNQLESSPGEEEDDEHRINLADADDGAAIVAANKEAKKPEKAIDGDDDSYMKNSCSAHKWVIIELSQLGRVDELEVVNKEMYSSRLKDFSVKGRQLHPRKDSASPDYPSWFETDHWPLLGEFTAANRKGSQIFKIPQKRRIRYLLVQFHSHYGSEEVCALNSISALGVSAAQELEDALAWHLHPGAQLHTAPPAHEEQFDPQTLSHTDPNTAQHGHLHTPPHPQSHHAATHLPHGSPSLTPPHTSSSSGSHGSGSPQSEVDANGARTGGRNAGKEEGLDGGGGGGGCVGSGAGCHEELASGGGKAGREGMDRGGRGEEEGGRKEGDGAEPWLHPSDPAQAPAGNGSVGGWGVDSGATVAAKTTDVHLGGSGGSGSDRGGEADQKGRPSGSVPPSTATHTGEGSRPSSVHGWEQQQQQQQQQPLVEGGGEGGEEGRMYKGGRGKGEGDYATVHGQHQQQQGRQQASKGGEGEEGGGHAQDGGPAGGQGGGSRAIGVDGVSGGEQGCTASEQGQIDTCQEGGNRGSNGEGPGERDTLGSSDGAGIPAPEGTGLQGAAHQYGRRAAGVGEDSSGGSSRDRGSGSGSSGMETDGVQGEGRSDLQGDGGSVQGGGGGSRQSGGRSGSGDGVGSGGSGAGLVRGECRAACGDNSSGKCGAACRVGGDSSQAVDGGGVEVGGGGRGGGSGEDWSNSGASPPERVHGRGARTEDEPVPGNLSHPSPSSDGQQQQQQQQQQQEPWQQSQQQQQHAPSPNLVSDPPGTAQVGGAQKNGGTPPLQPSLHASPTAGREGGWPCPEGEAGQAGGRCKEGHAEALHTHTGGTGLGIGEGLNEGDGVRLEGSAGAVDGGHSLSPAAVSDIREGGGGRVRAHDGEPGLPTQVLGGSDKEDAQLQQQQQQQQQQHQQEVQQQRGGVVREGVITRQPADLQPPPSDPHPGPTHTTGEQAVQAALHGGYGLEGARGGGDASAVEHEAALAALHADHAAAAAAAAARAGDSAGAVAGASGVGARGLQGPPPPPPLIALPEEMSTGVGGGGAAAGAGGGGGIGAAAGGGGVGGGMGSVGSRAAGGLPASVESPLMHLDHFLLAMEGGPAKHKHASNLFDLFKQEFVLLRVNQTRIWKYINSLVDVLNRNAAEDNEEVERLEGKIAEMRSEISSVPSLIEALKREMDAHYAPQLARVLLEVSDLRAEVRTGRARERALLLYGLLAMLLLVAGLLGRQSGRSPSRLMAPAISAMVCASIVIGMLLHAPRLQDVMSPAASYLRKHLRVR